jgi:hypothetical protein
MIARALLAALALLAATPAPAFAQTFDSGQASPAAMSAARDVAQLLFVDSGMVSLALDEAFTEEMPAIRAETMAEPFFRMLSRRDQQAVLAYLDTLPQVTGELIDQSMPDILDAVAARTAAIFSEEEIVGISAFLHSPHGRDIIMRMIQGAVEADSSAPASDDDVDLTSEEETALLAFALTRGGRAFIAKADRWGDALAAAFSDAAGELTPALQARVLRDICDILRDRCPPSLRPPSPT